MGLNPVTDPYVARIIPKAWASFGFDYLDLRSESEETGLFRLWKSNISYSTNGSFNGLGGFVQVLNFNTTNATIAKAFFNNLKNIGFIDL